MTPEQIQQLLDAILKTGEILSSNLWRITLQQVLVETVQWVVFMVIGLPLSTWLLGSYGRTRRAEAKKRGYKFDTDVELDDMNFEVGFSAIFLTIAGAVIILVSLIFGIPSVIGNIMNPEYQALLKILSLIPVQ